MAANQTPPRLGSEDEVHSLLLDYCRSRIEREVSDSLLREMHVAALSKSTGAIARGLLSPATLSFSVAIELGLAHELAVRLAAISVFLHTAADLSDDLEDDDLRGAVWERYGAAFADNVANGLLFICQREIGRLELAAEPKCRLHTLVAETGWRMHIGQHLDLYRTNRWPLSPSTPDDPGFVGEHKSGSELACFLAVPPIAAGVDDGAFRRFGQAAGGLMQLFSDYVDIWCKPESDDLRARKVTQPLATGLLNDQTHARLLRMMAGDRRAYRNGEILIRQLLCHAGATEVLVQERERYLASMDQALRDLPGHASLSRLRERLAVDTRAMIDGLQDLRSLAPLPEAVFPHLRLEEGISRALDIVQPTDLLRETWEFQRFGFRLTGLVVGDVFGPAMVADVLHDAGLDVSPVVDHLIARRSEDGWRYYPDLDEMPTDSDDLGQVLQLLTKAGLPETRLAELCNGPVQLLLSNVHEDGWVETWLADGVRFRRETLHDQWLGHRCLAVAANAYFGLLCFDPTALKPTLVRGAELLIALYEEEGAWSQAWHYGGPYTRLVCARFLTALAASGDIQQPLRQRMSSVLSDVRMNLLSTQRLDGGWGSPQETALALSTLAALGESGLAVERAAIFLLDSQTYDGSWRAENLYVCPGRDDEAAMYANRVVTTGICLKALLQGRRALAAGAD